MPWRRAEFKGQRVWALVDAGGALEVDKGRVPIRYQSKPGAKIYRGGAARIELDPDAPLEALDEGAPADDAPAKKAGAAKGRGSGFGSAGTRTEGQAAMAKEAAEALVADLTGRAVLCFTDGACKGNPGPAGSGAVVEVPGAPRRERSLSLGRATNNVAELTAVRAALEILDEMAVPTDAEVAVFTDSKYTMGVLTKGWKAKANAALIADLRARLSERPGVKMYWVAGHVGVEGNERADALANAGIAGSF